MDVKQQLTNISVHNDTVKGTSSSSRFGNTHTHAQHNFLHQLLLFYVQFFCSINFCIGPIEIRQFKTNYGGRKLDWGSPHGCSYLQNVYYVITLCCFTHIFCRLGLQTIDNGLVSLWHVIWSGLIIHRATSVMVVWIIVCLSLNKSSIVHCVPHYSGWGQLPFTNHARRWTVQGVGWRIFLSAYWSDATTGNISDIIF